MNRKLQKHEIYPVGYRRAAQSLASSLTQSELKLNYSSLVKQWPQYEKLTTKQYKVRLAAIRVRIR